MSLLTPLYALGLLAVSLPILFHLIRRQPRGQFEFSSLMFLSPSPPRLARRSRLDHLLLLLLRGLALSLLAFAFARPFLNNQTPPAIATGASTRAAIIIDTSASMRRGNLWQQAVAAIDKYMAERGPQDQVSLLACDDTLRPVISFENMAQISSAERRATVASRLKDMQPTWAATHLGQSLMEAVDLVNNGAGTRGEQTQLAQRIILVSDLQEGSRLNALADYPWPEDVELELKSVALKEKTNAGLHYVANDRENLAAAERELRVRVSNDAASTSDEFQLAWLDKSDKPMGDPTTVYVPAGESRIVRVPRPHPLASPTRLRLTGDNFDFDNNLYLTSSDQAPIKVLYLGADRADDPKEPRYYLERALTDGLSRPVTIVSPAAAKPLPLEIPTATPLVVVARALLPTEASQLRKYSEDGGTTFVLLRASEKVGDLPALVDSPSLNIEEANVNNYTMLGQIDFAHPLFAPMVGPHFNDFTQIHFWKYRRLKSGQLGSGRVLARFEKGDPVLVEWTIGKGRVLVLTSGWHPADSQLARSWKFVLFVSALVNKTNTTTLDCTAFTINDPIPLGEPAEVGASSITKPDATIAKIPNNQSTFTATDEPGIYTISTTTNTPPTHFAVNLDPLESKTAVVGAETLEQFGCRLVKPTALADATKKQQHLLDVQIESRQKLWQWLLVAVLGILVAETWLAGRAAKAPLTEGSPA